MMGGPFFEAVTDLSNREGPQRTVRLSKFPTLFVLSDMFLGHFAMGFAAKALVPRVSLGTFMFASLVLDFLWSALLLVGLEQVVITPGSTSVADLDFTHYPFSHSFVAVIGWGLLIAGGYLGVRRSAWEASVLGGLVMSHWLLDLVVHRADLPLYPGGLFPDLPGSMVHLGLGLGHSLSATILVEGLLFVGGLFLYGSVTRATDRLGRYGFWAFGAVLAGSYAVMLVGPPPPSVAVVAWAGQLPWLFVGWAYWVDGRRAMRRVPAYDGPGRRRSAFGGRHREEDAVPVPRESGQLPFVKRDGAR